MNEIALLHAEAGSTPTGTGSFSFFTNFTLLVKNIAFEKAVGVWGHDVTSQTWAFFPGGFDRSLPNDAELWTVHVDNTEIDQFEARYSVGNVTFWDNNLGADYFLNVSAAHTDGTGTVVLNPNVMVVSRGGIDASGMLTVEVVVRNPPSRNMSASSIPPTTGRVSTRLSAHFRV